MLSVDNVETESIITLPRSHVGGGYRDGYDQYKEKKQYLPVEARKNNLDGFEISKSTIGLIANNSHNSGTMTPRSQLDSVRQNFSSVKDGGVEGVEE